MSLIKWTKPNTSDVIALISLFISIWLACIANSLANYANQMSNRAAIPDIKIDKVEAVNSEEKRITIFEGTDVTASGSYAKFSGEISLKYGELSELYLVNYLLPNDELNIKSIILSPSNNSKTEFNFSFYTDIQELGKSELISDRFYLVLIDSSKKMYRVLFDTNARAHYSVSPNDTSEDSEVIFYKNYRENPSVTYDIIDDFGLIVFSQEKYFEDEKRKVVIEEVSREIEEINQHFAQYGFSQ